VSSKIPGIPLMVQIKPLSNITPFSNFESEMFFGEREQ
jgi:hypothetical protein